ncbi:SdpA family antimicrobial peptide system protein [Ornithinimicrobium ciconiae]|uniref:SdpA family antimicrobial peptide system protein n=2 Tax=Ornithinimicrobium ciconiae TaxID=2594265 RepID=A0A516G7R4_9MICO|nr:SdpA family antimicrobial peptide system protein [Ornithinimicrobium ciconiae]
MSDLGSIEAVERKLGWQGLVSLLLVLGTLALTIFYSMPSNVLSTRDGSKLRTVSVELAQQSWVFFTRPPSYHELTPYSVEGNGEIVSALRFPQTNPDNLFGLARKQRAQGPEMANLVGVVGSDSWVACGDLTAEVDCARRATEELDVIEIVNTSTVPTICGKSVLVENEPVRWSFRDVYEGQRLPVRATLLEAKCEESR